MYLIQKGTWKRGKSGQPAMFICFLITVSFPVESITLRNIADFSTVV